MKKIYSAPEVLLLLADGEDIMATSFELSEEDIDEQWARETIGELWDIDAADE